MMKQYTDDTWVVNFRGLIGEGGRVCSCEKDGLCFSCGENKCANSFCDECIEKARIKWEK